MKLSMEHLRRRLSEKGRGSCAVSVSVAVNGGVAVNVNGGVNVSVAVNVDNLDIDVCWN